MIDETQDENEKDAAQQSAPQAFGRKKLLLIAAGGLVGCVLLIGTPLYFLSGDSKEEKPETEVVVPPKEDKEQQETAYLEGYNEELELGENEEMPGAIFPMESYVVNLASKGNYLRCQIQIEFEGLDVPQRFYARLVPIREGIIRILTSRKADEILNWDGKESLKDEIRTMINETLRKEVVRKVYFTQFVIQ